MIGIAAAEEENLLVLPEASTVTWLLCAEWVGDCGMGELVVWLSNSGRRDDSWKA